MSVSGSQKIPQGLSGLTNIPSWDPQTKYTFGEKGVKIPENNQIIKWGNTIISNGIISVFEIMGILVRDNVFKGSNPCLKHCIDAYVKNKTISMDNFMFIYNFFPTFITDRISRRIINFDVNNNFMEDGLLLNNVYSKMAFSILGSNIIMMKNVMPEICEDCSAKIQCHMKNETGDECCESSPGVC